MKYFLFLKKRKKRQPTLSRGQAKAQRLSFCLPVSQLLCYSTHVQYTHAVHALPQCRMTVIFFSSSNIMSVHQGVHQGKPHNLSYIHVDVLYFNLYNRSFILHAEMIKYILFICKSVFSVMQAEVNKTSCSGYFLSSSFMNLNIVLKYTKQIKYILNHTVYWRLFHKRPSHSFRLFRD